MEQLMWSAFGHENKASVRTHASYEQLHQSYRWIIQRGQRTMKLILTIHQFFGDHLGAQLAAAHSIKRPAKGKPVSLRKRRKEEKK